MVFLQPSLIKPCVSPCAAVGCCIHKQDKYSPVACAIIRAEMIITIHQDVRACASHDFCCVVLVLHLNNVSKPRVLILRGLILKQEADVVLVFPVPPHELKVIATEIMEFRISRTS